MKQRIESTCAALACAIGIGAGCSDSYDAHLTQELSQLDEGEYDEALNAAEAAIRARPDCFVAYAWRAAAHEKRGDFELALADYDTASRLFTVDPDCADDCSNGFQGSEIPHGRVEALIMLARYDDASHEMTALRAREPDHPGLWFDDGILALAAGDYERARAEFARCAARGGAGCHWRDLQASAFTHWLLGDRGEAVRLATLAAQDARDPSYRRSEWERERIISSASALRTNLESGDRKGIVLAFQRAEELARFPAECTEAWSRQASSR